MVEVEIRHLVRSAVNEVAMLNQSCAQVDIEPENLAPAGMSQQVIDSECPKFRRTPGLDTLTTHPVLELLLSLQHYHPCAVFGHRSGQG
jgi:hypothetical protein